MLRAYDFNCPTHGRFEMFVSQPPNADPPRTHACPQCGTGAERQFAAPMVNPKYVTIRGDIRRRAR